jgi:hypothetical protein
MAKNYSGAAQVLAAALPSIFWQSFLTGKSTHAGSFLHQSEIFTIRAYRKSMIARQRRDIGPDAANATVVLSAPYAAGALHQHTAMVSTSLKKKIPSAS